MQEAYLIKQIQCATIKTICKKMVLDGIKTFEKFNKVVKYTLINSILTKQYREQTQTLM